MRLKTLAAAMCLAAVSAEAKTVGVWYGDRKADQLTAALTTLSNANWRVVRFTRDAELCDEKKLAETDVMLFTGGWGIYYFPSPEARRQLVRYVAGGKGVLQGGFRSGYTRTANRPMFPEVGATHNRVNCPWIAGSGTNALARLFGGEALTFGGKDHLVLKVGPKGTVFAASGEDPVGAYGDVGFGRVVTFGVGFAYKAVDADLRTKERIFLGLMDYLSSAPQPDALAKRLAQDEAEAAFIRREATLTWTARTRGPDRCPGVIPGLRDAWIGEAEGRGFALRHLASVLDGACRKECADCADELARAAASMRTLCERECAATEKVLAEMPAARLAMASACRTPVSQLDEKRIAGAFERCLPASLRAKADALLAKYRPVARTVRRAAAERAHAEDLKLVPGLLADFAAARTNQTHAGAARRLALATELGRIGDARASKALAAALDDPCGDVRAQAAISLGWMQARDAVPALLAKAKPGAADVRLLRRAVQALGQIGDGRATGALLTFATNRTDGTTAAVAVTALGWLKARAAVKPLVELAKDKTADRNLRAAAARALGEIGDPAARIALEELAALEHDEPKGGLRNNRNGKIGNPLSTPQPRGVKLAAQQALAQLAKGGRPAAGVKQPVELSVRERFYAMTKRPNAFAGRVGTVGSKAVAPETLAQPDPSRAGRRHLWAQLADAGCTGIHNAWGNPEMDPEPFADLVRDADEAGLLWVEVMPWSLAPVDFEYVIAALEDVPGFTGFWSEECFPDAGMDGAAFDAELKAKHGADYARKLGLSAAETPFAKEYWDSLQETPTNAFAAPLNGALRGELLEIEMARSTAAWREAQDWLHGRRKGFAFTFSFSNADPARLIGGAALVDAIDCPGPECYQSFGRYNAFVMRRWMNGAARPAMAEFYNWYGVTHETDLRGFWQHAAHGKCFYNFALHQIFQNVSTYDNWSWEATRWNDFRTVFRRVRENAEYYETAPLATDVAIVWSERSSSLFKQMCYYQTPVLIRTEQSALAAWTALAQLHVPADVLWMESLTAAKLAKYRMLVLTSAKALSSAECDVLRVWVKAGGTLVASGMTAVIDPVTLKTRTDSALEDLFGVRRMETAFPAEGAHDSFMYDRRSGASATKVRGGLEGWETRVRFDEYVWRDVKPVTSIVKAKGADGSETEYDAALGYDRVRPLTAKVLSTFPNGDPAVTENAYGAGRCVFRANAHPELGHVNGRWEMFANNYAFWPGVKESLAAAWAKAGCARAVTPEGLDGEIEVTPEWQKDGARLAVHLLDYDAKRKGAIRGAKLTVGGTRPIRRVFHPDTKTDLKLSGRTVALRPFEVYDFVVVEFE